MIILTSSGLSSEKCLEEVKKHIGQGMRKSVIITTASENFKEKDKHIPKLEAELHTLGLDVELFDVEFENPAKLLNYDVILINGGNPFYLLYHLQRTECKKIFEEFLRQGKMIIGVSAGSVVLGTTCALIYEFDPQMNITSNLTDFTALNLVEVDICPHYSRFISKYVRFAERIEAFEIINRKNVIRLNDGEILIIENQKMLKI